MKFTLVISTPGKPLSNSEISRILRDHAAMIDEQGVQERPVTDVTGSPVGQVTISLDHLPPPAISADLRAFFANEIANEANGGDSPTTFRTAFDSLNQMPDDVVAETTENQDVDCVALVAELKALISKYGSDYIVAGNIEIQ